MRGERVGSIGYEAFMDEPGKERLELSYWRGEDHAREHVRQTVRLTATPQPLGGERWWMICPFSGARWASSTSHHSAIALPGARPGGWVMPASAYRARTARWAWPA
jgi:hypothetical protein